MSAAEARAGTVLLGLTDEQELLRQTAARFIESAWPLEAVRKLASSDSGVPATYLRGAADLGWFAMLVPEEDGGGTVSGQGVADAAIIAEERGRGLQPGPFVSTNVVASALAARGSSDQRSAVLADLVAGRRVATWVADGSAGWSPANAITVTPHADGFELTGRAGQVQDGVLADWFLVTAGGDGGPSQLLVAAGSPGLTVRRVGSLDLTQRVASVEFDGVRVPASSLVGSRGGAADDAERQLQLAALLVTCETLGALDALFEMTRRYAMDRVAFGRPIGSFQAVKHQLADLSLTLEAGKAVTATAVGAVQAAAPDAGEITSMAKSWVGDGAIDVAQGCLQVFGGIGYTWEHPAHLYVRRVTLNSRLFGQPDWHRERICRLQGL